MVVPLLKLNETPKAFANFSPRLEFATTLGMIIKLLNNPEKGSPTAEPFQGWAAILNLCPRVLVPRTLG